MSCPFSPLSLLSKVKSINGFDKINFPSLNLMEFVDEVCYNYSDWPEGQGFGSSDGTYAAKEVLDMICSSFFNGSYKTDFVPFLSVVEC